MCPGVLGVWKGPSKAHFAQALVGLRMVEQGASSLLWVCLSASALAASVPMPAPVVNWSLCWLSKYV